MKTKEEIFTGMKLPGIPMLLFNILLFLAVIGAFAWLVNAADTTLPTGLTVVYSILIALLFIFCCISFAGYMIIEPNEARVMIFFGKYEGTVKENGFFWVNPFYTKKELTLRARNLDAPPIKVNDKKGNPVSIGQVVVWRVADTYKASFNIDTTSQAKVSVSPQTPRARLMEIRLLDKMKAYENFVKVQSDAALRYVAGLFAYDHSENEDEKLTLRSGGQEINEILEKQLSKRLVIAGIEIVEARVNYLAYAPEIAAVMLRRQQADAIISAREKIVDGAVGMVKHALEKLSEEAVVELDADKRAAMVSNLLVVLCSDEHAQPVVNTGTLYN